MNLRVLATLQIEQHEHEVVHDVLPLRCLRRDRPVAAAEVACALVRAGRLKQLPELRAHDTHQEVDLHHLRAAVARRLAEHIRSVEERPALDHFLRLREAATSEGVRGFSEHAARASRAEVVDHAGRSRR